MGGPGGHGTWWFLCSRGYIFILSGSSGLPLLLLLLKTTPGTTTQITRTTRTAPVLVRSPPPRTVNH